jgi:hypothetical protein
MNVRVSTWAMAGRGGAYFWVYILDNVVAARDFSFRLKITDDNSGNSINVRGPVIPFTANVMGFTYKVAHPHLFIMTFSEAAEFWGQVSIL